MGIKEVKITAVLDTREQEYNDRGSSVGVPGTGIPHECDRCGRDHEIHAFLDVGEDSYIMGVSCARKMIDGPEYWTYDVSKLRTARLDKETDLGRYRLLAARLTPSYCRNCYQETEGEDVCDMCGGIGGVPLSVIKKGFGHK